METLIIQTGTRHGRVAELLRSKGDVLSVGRSFDNDLVLTDIHVAPKQIEFVRRGEDWILSVIDDTNPVLLNGEKVVGEAPVIKSGDRITVGRTRLLVYSEGHHVEPTRKLVLSNWLSGEPVNPLLPIAVLALGFLFEFCLTYFEGSTSLKWKETASDVLMSVVVVLGWAGIWAIAGRIIRHQHHLGLQIIATIVVVMVFANAAMLLTVYIAYPFQSVMVENVLNWGLAFVTLALLLRCNLLVASNLHRTGLVASVIAALVVGVLYGFYHFNQSDQLRFFRAYAGELVPPVLGLQWGESLERYDAGVSEIIAELDSQLTESGE